MANIFQATFTNAFWTKNVWNTIEISLKFVLKDPINNIPALDQATSHYLNQL